MNGTEVATTRKRGFAAMTPERRAEVARLGGVAAHAKGTAHKWRPGKEAENAGRKGGSARRKTQPQAELPDAGGSGPTQPTPNV